MKIYLVLQTKKLHMDETVKKRKLDVEEAMELKKLEIEATNVDTKAQEVALAIMSVNKNNMSPEKKVTSFVVDQHDLV
ncbi:Receptor-like protein kinase HSL1 [Hordeum vulgare]|nr:Receptor-like protein kinase HSL1 [Hordeum vulgare]